MAGFGEGSWIVDRGSWIVDRGGLWWIVDCGLWMKEEAGPETWEISLKFLMWAFILPWMSSIMIQHSKNRERISHHHRNHRDSSAIFGALATRWRMACAIHRSQLWRIPLFQCPQCDCVGEYHPAELHLPKAWTTACSMCIRILFSWVGSSHSGFISRCSGGHRASIYPDLRPTPDCDRGSCWGSHRSIVDAE